MNYGRDRGVRRGLGVGIALGVAGGLGVAVGAGVVGVGDGGGVFPCTSNEPISMRPFTTRLTLGPRWSKKGGGAKFGLPASIAGLSGDNSCVGVRPPLSCNGPRIGSVLI